MNPFALTVENVSKQPLSPELRARHGDVPWPQIRAAGNVYRHEYREVLEEFVIDAATRQLDALERAVHAELTNLRKTP